MTDELRSYNGLCMMYGHEVVKYAFGEYVNGAAHTNTLEGFGSLLKRGVIGQYHYATPKYLYKYIDEFCFRYNNRDNESIFELTIEK